MAPIEMQVNGKSEVYFVVADPVAQVKAPAIFNHVFARAGIDAVVVPAKVTAAQLPGFVRTVLSVENMKGLFVSIPHKTLLLEVLDRFDATSQAAGAANAVRRGSDGALEGALFDGAGFVASLRVHGVALEGRRALLVGGGGAGLAIADALGECPLAALTVVDKDISRARTLVERVAPRAAFPIRSALEAQPQGYDLIINATPLGLRPNDPLPFDVSNIDAGSVVMDILMTRSPTPLLRACAALGIAAYSGYEMLIQQVPAYLEYFGHQALAQRLRTGRDPLMDEVRALMGAPEAAAL